LRIRKRLSTDMGDSPNAETNLAMKADLLRPAD